MTQKNKIIDTICSRTTSFIINTSKSERKKYGQFLLVRKLLYTWQAYLIYKKISVNLKY